MSSSNKKPMKIVIIEDEESLRLLYMAKFRQSGFEVADAANGTDGLRVIHEQKPDIILLDILMPHMNGFEVMKLIKADTDKVIRDIPVLFLTNLAEDAGFEQGNALGAAGYVVKATRSPEELVHLVNAIVATTRKGPHAK